MANKQPKPIPELTQEEIAKFWANVDRSGGPDACWPWLAGRTSNGYGAFAPRADLNIGAHRVAFKLHYGRDPDPLALHRCDNPPCCNGAHLFDGTHKDNAQDRSAKGRSCAGDRQWLRQHPERISGDNNWTRKHPEWVKAPVIPPERRARGERNGSSKLTTEQVLEIRRRYDPKSRNQSALGREFGVSNAMIGHIVHRKQWQHI